jgi:hypothetical protein
MCDYSLHAQKTRDAEQGDVLETCTFLNTYTHGLRLAGGDQECATCLKEGTELAFEKPPLYSRNMLGFNCKVGNGETAVKFVRVNAELPCSHHDAVEFLDGSRVLINDLATDLRVTVLQLPAKPVAAEPKQEAVPQEIKEPADLAV